MLESEDFRIIISSSSGYRRSFHCAWLLAVIALFLLIIFFFSWISFRLEKRELERQLTPKPAYSVSVRSLSRLACLSCEPPFVLPLDPA